MKKKIFTSSEFVLDFSFFFFSYYQCRFISSGWFCGRPGRMARKAWQVGGLNRVTDGSFEGGWP